MKIVVVMPMYNERPNVEAIVSAVLGHGPEWNVLVVDDNSPDGTGEAADKLAAADGHVTVLHRPGKLGLGTAYRDGLSRALAADADYVCTMDSDFSHDPAMLPHLLALARRHGAAHGSRYVAGGGTRDWGLLRKANSAMANRLTRLALGARLRDCTSGFRCYRRDVLVRMDPATLRARGYAVLEEMLFRCLRVSVEPAEHPIVFADRKAGESKINLGESVKGLLTLLRLRLSRWRGPKAAPVQESARAK